MIRKESYYNKTEWRKNVSSQLPSKPFHLFRQTPWMCDVPFSFLCMKVLIMERRPWMWGMWVNFQFPCSFERQKTKKKKIFFLITLMKNPMQVLDLVMASGVPVLFICYSTFYCCVKTHEKFMLPGKGLLWLTWSQVSVHLWVALMVWSKVT